MYAEAKGKFKASSNTKGRTNIEKIMKTHQGPHQHPHISNRNLDVQISSPVAILAQDRSSGSVVSYKGLMSNYLPSLGKLAILNGLIGKAAAHEPDEDTDGSANDFILKLVLMLMLVSFLFGTLIGMYIGRYCGTPKKFILAASAGLTVDAAVVEETATQTEFPQECNVPEFIYYTDGGVCYHHHRRCRGLNGNRIHGIKERRRCRDCLARD